MQLTATVPPVAPKVAVRVVDAELEDAAGREGPGVAGVERPAVPGDLVVGAAVERLDGTEVERLAAVVVRGAAGGPDGAGSGVPTARSSTVRPGRAPTGRSATDWPTTWTAPHATAVAVVTPSSHPPTSSTGLATMSVCAGCLMAALRQH